jgi:hypothetical protein
VPPIPEPHYQMSHPNLAARREAFKRVAEKLDAVGLGADAYTQVAAKSTAAGKALAATHAISASVLGNIRGALLFTGIFSVGWNTGAVLLKKSSVPQAGAAVAGDLVASVVGGAAGAAASTVGTIVLGTVMGPGPALTLAAGLLGIGTFLVADYFVKRSSLYATAKQRVREALSSSEQVR